MNLPPMVTPRAFARLAEINAGGPGPALRVAVLGGGCSGFSYAFDIARARAADDVAIEMPQAVRRQLGLSGERSWIVVSEWNRYAWPGYDTRPIPGREPSTSYGFLPSSLLQRVLDTMVAVGIGRPVDRD